MTVTPVADRDQNSTLAPRLSRREILTLFLILAAALAVRIFLTGLERVIRWDEPDYLALGINLFSGAGYTTGVAPELHYTPLFPIISGLFYLLVRNPEVASNIVYVIAGTLLIVPIYLIARRIYGQRVAVITACLLVVYPALSASVLYWGTMTEPLYVLLVYSAFYAALLAAEDNKVSAFVAAGALLGLGYLTRPEALITLLALLAYLALLRLLQRRLFNRGTVLRLAAFVLAFALVAAPYLGFLYAKSGRLLISGKLGLTYAMGQAVLDKDPAEYDRLIASLDSTGQEIVWYSPDRFSYSVLDDLLADPLAFVRRIVANARILSGQLFSHTIFPTILGVPLLLGLLDVAWDRQRLRRELFLAAIVAAPLVAFLPFHIEIRFFAPLFPVLLIWTAHGLVYAGRWLAATGRALLSSISENGRGQQMLTILPTAILLAYFALMIPLVVRSGQRALDWTHKDAGLWLKHNTAEGSVIMSRDLAIALYAGRPWIPSPNAAYDLTMGYAQHHNASYFVVDDAEITTLKPQWKALLDDQNPAPGLLHEETFTHGSQRTIIYRIP